MPRFIVQADVTAQIAPTTVLLIALQTNLMAQMLREAMDGRLIYTPINQFSWLCTDFCLALLFRTPTSRKSYLLTHHCVPAETLGSFSPTWVRKDPKVLVETQRWVKIYRSSFKITLLGLKNTRKSYLLTPPLPFNEPQNFTARLLALS